MLGLRQGFGRLRRLLVYHLAESQNRNAYLLAANTMVGAATGLLFWILLARIGHLTPAEIGMGYAIIALGTTVAVVAKGGLDTALIRSIPGTDPREATRLLRFGVVVGGCSAVLLAIAVFAGSFVWRMIPDFDLAGWGLVGLIGVLLVVTWLQDAYFVGEGDAKPTFQRNMVFSAGKLVLPVPLVLLARGHAVALAWALALFVSAMLALTFRAKRRSLGRRRVPRQEFMRSAARNITGSAAEFLPGLLMAPVVLAVLGAESAGYFGIAWTGATLLFLVSAAIGRSALSEMVHNGHVHYAQAIRRATRQQLGLVAPAAVAGILLAPYVLGVFGADYAREASLLFVVLCASTLFVAPAYLYLAVLRSRERPLPLVLFPAGMIIGLFTITPIFAEHLGLSGVGLAWLVANVPFGVYAAIRLRHETMHPKEVTNDLPTQHHSGRAHLE